MVVLDRPNPVTGLIVDGPLADESDLGFTAYAPIPVAHGMTVGELARIFNVERNIHCDLTVVPDGKLAAADVVGRNRPDVGQPLAQPPQPDAGAALPRGRAAGGGQPFGRPRDGPAVRAVRRPWVDGRKLAAALNAANLPGLRFTPVTFTPKSSKFADKECQGVYVTVTDREAAEPVRAGLTIAWELRRLFGEKFDLPAVGRMVRNAETADALRKADDPRTLPAVWEKPLEEFKKARRKYLIYN